MSAFVNKFYQFHATYNVCNISTSGLLSFVPKASKLLQFMCAQTYKYNLV